MKISESIGDLTNLKDLNICKNQLSELPHTVSQLINLDYLDIAETSFPQSPNVFILCEISSTLNFPTKVQEQSCFYLPEFLDILIL